MSLRKLPHLVTARLELRLGADRDVPEILRFLQDNQEFLGPFEPQKPAGYFTESFWKDQLRRSLLEFYSDQSIRLFLLKKGADGIASEVIGTVNFTQIFRGPIQACYLGYSLAQEDQGQGFITEALRGAINFVFEEFNLHRIVANYMPHNDRSARVLKRLGFVEEGLAKNYLMIEGQWRDHVLTSLTHPAWRPEAK